MSAPFIVSKNLGKRFDIENADFPVTNADGKPVVPLTDEQKYLFDMRGWLLVPGVLTADEAAEMRSFCTRLKNDPESIPESERSTLGGPLQQLADHPVVVGFMNEFLAHPELSSQVCYGFRQESSNLIYRTAGEGEFGPHNGNGLLRFPGDSHHYQCIPGKAHSGLSRVVWELNAVDKGDGGTLLVTGSHKAVFPAPDALQDPSWPNWDTYSCPEGSVLFFTEALTHSAQRWANPNRPRVAIFSCYNTVNSKWHAWEPNPELLASMPPMRQTLYRPVRAANNLVGAEYRH